MVVDATVKVISAHNADMILYFASFEFFQFLAGGGDRALLSASSLTLAPNRVRCVGTTAPHLYITKPSDRCHYIGLRVCYSLIYLIHFSFFADVQVNSQSELVLSRISIKSNKLSRLQHLSVRVFIAISKEYSVVVCQTLSQLSPSCQPLYFCWRCWCGKIFFESLVWIIFSLTSFSNR